jgi:hypothetical protein
MNMSHLLEADWTFPLPWTIVVPLFLAIPQHVWISLNNIALELAPLPWKQNTVSWLHVPDVESDTVWASVRRSTSMRAPPTSVMSFTLWRWRVSLLMKRTKRSRSILSTHFATESKIWYQVSQKCSLSASSTKHSVFQKPSLFYKDLTNTCHSLIVAKLDLFSGKLA